MGWKIVKQPNGKFARFSDVVDNFTHLDMTEEEAFDVCLEKNWGGMMRHDAALKVKLGRLIPARFDASLRTIEAVHGLEEAERLRVLLSD